MQLSEAALETAVGYQKTACESLDSLRRATVSRWRSSKLLGTEGATC